MVFVNNSINKMLYIIIGLPGSGKTHLLHSFGDHSKNHINIFDDCLSNIWNGKLFDAIKRNDVVVADPRFCDINIYTRFVNDISSFVDQSNIQIILFENNPKQCKMNISNPKRHIDIDNYSKIYDLNNYSRILNKIEYKTVFKN